MMELSQHRIVRSAHNFSFDIQLFAVLLSYLMHENRVHDDDGAYSGFYFKEYFFLVWEYTKNEIRIRYLVI